MFEHIDNKTYWFVLPNQVTRRCDYYSTIFPSQYSPPSPTCPICNKKYFVAYWHHNGSCRGQYDFFCNTCSSLVDISDTIDIHRNDRRLICYDIDGNSIPFDNNTQKEPHGYTKIYITTSKKTQRLT